MQGRVFSVLLMDVRGMHVNRRGLGAHACVYLCGTGGGGGSDFVAAIYRLHTGARPARCSRRIVGLVGYFAWRRYVCTRLLGADNAVTRRSIKHGLGSGESRLFFWEWSRGRNDDL